MFEHVLKIKTKFFQFCWWQNQANNIFRILVTEMLEYFFVLTCLRLLPSLGFSSRLSTEHYVSLSPLNISHSPTLYSFFSSNESNSITHRVSAELTYDKYYAHSDEILYYDQNHDIHNIAEGDNLSVKHLLSSADKISENDAWVLRELQHSIDSFASSLSSSVHHKGPESPEQDIYSSRYSETKMEKNFTLRIFPNRTLVSRSKNRSERNVYVHLAEDSIVPCYEWSLGVREFTWSEFKWFNNNHQPISQEGEMFARISITDSQELWVGTYTRAHAHGHIHTGTCTRAHTHGHMHTGTYTLARSCCFAECCRSHEAVNKNCIL